MSATWISWPQRSDNDVNSFNMHEGHVIKRECMISPFCPNKFSVRLTPEGCACGASFLSALLGQARVNVHVDKNFLNRRQEVTLTCRSHYPPIHTNNFVGFIGCWTHVFSCLTLKSKFRSVLVDAQPTF